MRYKDRYIPEPRMRIPNRKFKEQAYSLWSVEEVVSRIMDSPFESPFTTIEQFILELDFCIYFSGDKSCKSIFTTAKSVAEDILDHLLI